MVKINKGKLYEQIETMNKEQLIELCKSTTSIIDDLQQRINRAIEYIETENSIGNEIEYTTRLLDILRGKEVENE